MRSEGRLCDFSCFCAAPALSARLDVEALLGAFRGCTLRNREKDRSDPRGEGASATGVHGLLNRWYRLVFVRFVLSAVSVK